MTIFRANSEIAVAIKVASVAPKPIVPAMVLPRCRAKTMSTSEPMLTRISCGNSMRSSGVAGRLVLEVRETLLQVERRSHAFHGQTELHHGKRDFRLYAHDYRILRRADVSHW